MTRYCLAEPDFALLRQVEVYAAGPAAIAQRDELGGAVFGEAFSTDEVPDIDPVATEAIVGALYSLYQRINRTRGPAALPEDAPHLTYVTLAPMLGAERACEVANCDGR